MINDVVGGTGVVVAGSGSSQVARVYLSDERKFNPLADGNSPTGERGGFYFEVGTGFGTYGVLVRMGPVPPGHEIIWWWRVGRRVNSLPLPF